MKSSSSPPALHSLRSRPRHAPRISARDFLAPVRRPVVYRASRIIGASISLEPGVLHCSLCTLLSFSLLHPMSRTRSFPLPWLVRMLVRAPGHAPPLRPLRTSSFASFFPLLALLAAPPRFFLLFLSATHASHVATHRPRVPLVLAHVRAHAPLLSSVLPPFLARALFVPLSLASSSLLPAMCALPCPLLRARSTSPTSLSSTLLRLPCAAARVRVSLTTTSRRAAILSQRPKRAHFRPRPFGELPRRRSPPAP